MKDDELNEALMNGLADATDEDSPDIWVEGLTEYGKLVPYIGWYWREVDFSNLSLGNCGDFIGFMENNKWGYPFVRVTDEQTKQIRTLMEAYVQKPTQDTAQALFDFMQSLR